MNTQLLRFNRKQKYIIFDTETEGLNLIKSKPWQAAWIVAEGNRIIKKYDKLIKWDDLKVSKDAARITGFNRGYYESNAEDPKLVWNEFAKYLYDDDYLVVGQNLLGFDVYMVDVWRKLIGEPLRQDYINRIIDTKAIATAIEKEAPVDKKDFIYWQYRWLNYRQRGLKTSQLTLLKKYDIDFDQKRLHDALYDIEMNFEIFHKQLYDIEL
ncbi:MAG: 3'-5' exonuclease [Candidatus Lokiarchaeota archaeon]|nr:3'-5' exonuclease [Candidatus Lokiarchaeota archaeon]